MSKAPKNSHNDILQRLETELIHLKRKFQMGHELRLQMIPNNGPKSGEVIGEMRHEFIEYVLVNELVAPYKRLVNKLITLFEEEMYRRKERLVEKFLEANLS